MSILDHQRVLEAAARGDDHALELLIRAYHDRVYRFGLRVCRDRFDAEDAVQQAFMTLARRPDVLRDQGALSWLMTVVRNACRKLLRPFLGPSRALGERIEDAELLEEPALDPEAMLDRWRLVHLVHRAIATLEHSHREVLVMRDVEGLTGEEVCRALGISEAAMKSRLHRARSEVRARLAEWTQPKQELN
jgi:RNA polymerase sigma-70 factor (ECF subfamily)